MKVKISYDDTTTTDGVTVIKHVRKFSKEHSVSQFVLGARISPINTLHAE